MAKNRNLLFYLVVIGVFGGLMYGITLQGENLETGKLRETQPSLVASTPFELFRESFENSLVSPLAVLILQIISIIVVSRIFSAIFNKIGQPTVIGEIIAGIVLGPSVVGLFFPEVSGFLFPKGSLPNLQFLSQIGLILFMFVIGMELDLKILRNKANHAIIISHTSIIVSFFLGTVLAYYLYTEFAPENISFLSFSLFMGIALSITAFPVLARIIQERDLTKTRMGTIAITSAASDDITAWCMLAAVIAVTKAGSMVSAFYTIGLALAFILSMIFFVRPFLTRLGNIYSEKETISKTIVAIAFIILLASAYLSEIIGIHPLFGAFLAGVLMPPNFNFRRILMEKIEDVSVVLLLPLFFVFTGLRTEIGLLNEPHLWAACGLIVCAAVAGKFGVGTLTSRFVGQTWKESLSIGALMNTRGLMELIVLNIGYDLGVLTPEVFAMMVLMALVTTFMTGPALDLINVIFPDRIRSAVEKNKFYKILIAFGPPEKGRKLLRLADQLTHKKRDEVNMTAFHLTPSADINPKEAREYEQETFRLVRQESEHLGIKVKTLYRATNDPNKEITREVNKGKYDLLLVGGSNSLFSDDVVGGKVKKFLEETQGHVGVLVDKNFEVADNILVMVQDFNDLFLITFAERFIVNNNAMVMVSDPHRLFKTNMIFTMAFEKINEENPQRLTLNESHVLDPEFLQNFNIILVSTSGWKDLPGIRNTAMSESPSILILKP